MTAKNTLRSMASKLKGRLRRAHIYARWLRHEVPHAPRYEFYARGMARQNRAAFFAERRAGVPSKLRKYAPFGGHEIPKIIWMYWHQGEESAPLVVQRCIESWRRHNPDWEVRVLDAQTVADYADMGDLPQTLPFRFHADLLRLRLLKDHGGIWADATVYCHRPLDDWFPVMVSTGFFILRNPGPDRWISSWFIISEPGHVLVTAWEEAYAPYVRRLKYVPDIYFVFFYTFQWRLKIDPEAMAALIRAPSLPAQPSLVMMDVLRGNLPVKRLHEMLACGTPVSKLSWKTELSEAEFDKFCDALDAL